MDPAGNTIFQMSKSKPGFRSLSGVWTSLTASNSKILTNLYLNRT